jgi:hypothetical protein
MFITRGTEYHAMGPSLWNSGFRNKLILPWNDFIPMCVPQNFADSTEFHGFRKMRPGRNQNTKRNAHPRVGIVQVIRQTTTQFPPQTSSPWCSVCPPHGVDSMNRPNPICGWPSTGVVQGLFGGISYISVKYQRN